MLIATSIQFSNNDKNGVRAKDFQTEYNALDASFPVGREKGWLKQ